MTWISRYPGQHRSMLPSCATRDGMRPGSVPRPGKWVAALAPASSLRRIAPHGKSDGTEHPLRALQIVPAAIEAQAPKPGVRQAAARRMTGRAAGPGPRSPTSGGPMPWPTWFGWSWPAPETGRTDRTFSPVKKATHTGCVAFCCCSVPGRRTPAPGVRPQFIAWYCGRPWICSLVAST